MERTLELDILVAARSGLYTLTFDGVDWQIDPTALAGQQVNAVIGRGGVILAGTNNGVYRSADGGASWLPANQGLVQQHIRWLAFDPSTPDLEYAGTEPAGIYVSHDGGGLWANSPEVEQLRDRYGWFLPYSPAAGCVRGFAFSGRITYAAVEVGGLLTSSDGGRSWALARGSTGEPAFGRPPEGKIHPDVHSIETHPGVPGLLHAPTGGGLYRSKDGGDSWEQLHHDYCRAVWVNPANAAHLLLGPAQNPSGRDGRLEESLDGGATWRRTAPGADIPWRQKMVERLVPAGDHLFAVLSNGELLVSRQNAWHWRRALEGLDGVLTVAPYLP
jgi:photosystem II stability/assembly factor-like uncharacterized protein